MQLKKNSRDSHYPEPRAEYQEEPPMDEATENSQASDPQSVTRPTRRPEFEGAVASRSATADRPASVIDAHSSFDGRYETDQDLRIEGRISGEVVCRGLLTIEQDATASAKIQAHDALVRGRIEGDIVCTGRLLLTSTAVVTGTMVAGALVVEEGATLSGKVETASAASTGRLPAEMPAPLDTSSAPVGQISRVTQMNPDRAADATTPTTSTMAPSRATRREVPSFALVSSDDRNSLDRN